MLATRALERRIRSDPGVLRKQTTVFRINWTVLYGPRPCDGYQLLGPGLFGRVFVDWLGEPQGRVPARRYCSMFRRTQMGQGYAPCAALCPPCPHPCSKLKAAPRERIVVVGYNSKFNLKRIRRCRSVVLPMVRDRPSRTGRVLWRRWLRHQPVPDAFRWIRLRGDRD
jgi:hypothetical protein